MDPDVRQNTSVATVQINRKRAATQEENENNLNFSPAVFYLHPPLSPITDNGRSFVTVWLTRPDSQICWTIARKISQSPHPYTSLRKAKNVIYKSS